MCKGMNKMRGRVGVLESEGQTRARLANSFPAPGACFMSRFLYIVLALLFLTSLHADPVQPAKDKEPKPAKEATATQHDKWTVDHVLLAPAAGQFQVAPDGRSVVWVKTAMGKDK